VADGAVGQATGGVDLVLPNELKSLAFLIGRRLPMEVVDFGTRPDVILRGAVTLEAPLHIERLRAASERHLVERAMTGGAADTFGDVDAVIEEDEIRQIVYPVPFDRFVNR
jgi:hypothetical protein